MTVSQAGPSPTIQGQPLAKKWQNSSDERRREGPLRRGFSLESGFDEGDQFCNMVTEARDDPEDGPGLRLHLPG